jgi:hypothetical protein
VVHSHGITARWGLHSAYPQATTGGEFFERWWLHRCDLGRRRGPPLFNFLQRELDPKPPRELLVPLLPPTTPEKRWIDLARRFCSKIGFGSCGSKSEENMPLFIGVLVRNRSARRVLTDFILGLVQNRVGWRESKWG